MLPCGIGEGCGCKSLLQKCRAFCISLQKCRAQCVGAHKVHAFCCNALTNALKCYRPCRHTACM